MSETASWQPSASIPNLLKRATIMAEIRRFFADRGVLEVETPCMSQATVTDILVNDQPGIPYETPAGCWLWAGIPAVPQLP